MDLLLGRQPWIQDSLRRRHLAGPANPSRDGVVRPVLLVDGRLALSASQMGLLPRRQEGPAADRIRGAHRSRAPPGRSRGVPRQHRRPGRVHSRGAAGAGTVQADRPGAGRRPRDDHSARITALGGETGLGWLTALRGPAIKKLAAAEGPLQPTLFDQDDLAEITHPDYTGGRLIACRNPFPGRRTSPKRDVRLRATEDANPPATEDGLAPAIAAVHAGRLSGADRIGLRVGKIINRYKMAKHFDVA